MISDGKSKTVSNPKSIKKSNLISSPFQWSTYLQNNSTGIDRNGPGISITLLSSAFMCYNFVKMNGHLLDLTDRETELKARTTDWGYSLISRDTDSY